MEDGVAVSTMLPGFRFHPTEEELLEFYLRNTILQKKMHLDVIGFLNIYHHDPWDLPGLAQIGEREWYFFVGRERKASNGGRPNRTTEKGFWKATGSDRKVFTLSDPKRLIGYRKTLVFYRGRAPRGTKTDWIMSEYRLPHNSDMVLCKVYRKATSLKVLEQWAANAMDTSTSTSTQPPSNTLKLPVGQQLLPNLQLPNTIDWAQDPIFAQICSPWLQNILKQFTPPALTSFPNILHF